MDIVGLVLMGGKSTRMQQDKAYVTYQNIPFYKHAMHNLSMLPKTYLSVAKKSDITPTYPIVEDQYLEVGPIGGICSALEEIECEALFVLSCDIPTLPKVVVSSLLEHYRMHQRPVILVEGTRWHPLIGIYPKTCLPYLQAQIQKQQYKMMRVIKALAFDTLELSTIVDSSILNINTPSDIEKLKQ